MTAGIGLAIMYINLTCVGIVYGLDASLGDFIYDYIGGDNYNFIG